MDITGKHRVHWIAISTFIAVLGAIGVGLWWGDERNQTTIPSSGSHSDFRDVDGMDVTKRRKNDRNQVIRFDITDGSQLSYAYSMDGNVQLQVSYFFPDRFKKVGRGKGGQFTRLHTLCTGILHLKFYKAEKGIWNTAARITDIQYEINGQVPAYTNEMEFPFAFDMNDQGEFSNFRFTRGISPAAASVLEVLMQNSQMLFPKQAAPSWETSEKDGVGSYEASYKMDSLTDGDSEFSIIKENVSYSSVKMKDGLQINSLFRNAEIVIDEAITEFIVSPSARQWIVSLDQRVKLQSESRGREIYGVDHHLSLDRSAAASTDGVTFPKHFAEFQAELESSRYLLATMRQTDPTLDKMGKYLSLSEALEKYKALLSSDDYRMRELAEPFLVNYLKLHPSASAVLIEHLNKHPEAYGEKTQLVLWRLITEAEIPAAQEAVMYAAQEKSYSKATRIRAMAYVSDFDYPTDELVDELWQFYQDHKHVDRSDLEGELKTMSIFALGILGDREKGNEHLKSLIRERLISSLHSAKNSWDKRMALGAIGNYGKVDILSETEPYLTDSNPDVRSAAYMALRGMQAEEVERTLIEHYQKESSPEVRKTALKALAYMSPTARGLEWTRKEVVKAAGNSNEQIALVTLLGNSLEFSPANERTMRELLADNPPLEVKKEIYRYIAPE